MEWQNWFSVAIFRRPPGMNINLFMVAIIAESGSEFQLHRTLDMILKKWPGKPTEIQRKGAETQVAKQGWKGDAPRLAKGVV